eukprot:gb/GECG01005200.1/.p1 GENE.gb/GECG01005200.1/~~gb/GECG01005200.1/.p1  ORF type:complete len:579 (+),score=67.26 gb/GECG01005200.1/:1-1737(+)
MSAASGGSSSENPWKVATSRSTGLQYYWNPHTGERLWKQRKQDESLQGPESSGNGTQKADTASKRRKCVLDLPYPWAWRLNQATGGKDYVNLETRETKSEEEWEAHMKEARIDASHAHEGFEVSLALVGTSGLEWISYKQDNRDCYLVSTSDRKQALVFEAVNSGTAQYQLRFTDPWTSSSSASLLKVQNDTSGMILLTSSNTGSVFRLVRDREMGKSCMVKSDSGAFIAKSGASDKLCAWSNPHEACEFWPDFRGRDLKQEFLTGKNSTVTAFVGINGLRVGENTLVKKGFRGEIHDLPSFRSIGECVLKIQPWDSRTMHEVWSHKLVNEQASKMGIGKSCCQLIDCFWDKENCFAILRKYGASLDSKLKLSDSQRSYAYDRLSPIKALDIGKQISEAIKVVHACGFVYMDLHPGNVLLNTSLGSDVLEVVLTDFGSCQKGALNDMNQLVYMGPTRGGRWDFMPPEQFDKETKFSASGDTFCIGSVLYTLLAGYPPFAPGEGEKLRRSNTQSNPHRGPRGLAKLKASLETIADPPVPNALIDVIVKSMNPEPSQRYTNIASLLEALDSVYSSVTDTM